MTLWRGPSSIDGQPVAAVLTGLERRSKNSGTGPVLQAWFFRQDLPPIEARQGGEDASVCGDCLYRDGTCYVGVHREVTSVWRAYTRDRYPLVPPSLIRHHLFQVDALVAWHGLRWGAYGDPACVPLGLTELFYRQARPGKVWLSYTHQWHDPRFRDLRHYCMASVDSPEQREAAIALGFKPFRVRSDIEPLEPGEFVCPKSEEAGRALTCDRCKACHGGIYRGQASPTVRVHAGLAALNTRFAGNPRRFALPLVAV